MTATGVTAATPPEPRGEDDVIVGFALTEKKCRSLFSPELIRDARCVPKPTPSRNVPRHSASTRPARPSWQNIPVERPRSNPRDCPVILPAL